WQKISPWAVWHQIEWFLLGLIALFLFRRPIKDLLPHRADKTNEQPLKPEETSADTRTVSEADAASAQSLLDMDAEGGALLNLAGISEGRLEDNMNIIKNLIRSDPARAVEVIREWIGNPGEGEIND
ncbi:hypothetical protein, partial [Acidithiobacillus thiooxidans]|uniref:hypothetical protein n=1 Tax=Acidithiobacillus thiooxidans TaxID=930 RepID=UPI001C0770F6